MTDNDPNVTWPDIWDIHTIIFDFDGVFTDNKVYVSQDGLELVRCDRGDGLAIDFLRQYRAKKNAALEFFVVSTEQNPVVKTRARKLGIDVHQNVRDKLAFVLAHLEKHDRPFIGELKGLVYLGNDLNDLSILERAQFSIVPADAHARVRSAASVVLTEKGGEGFVRAAIERLLRIDQMTSEEIHELVY